MGYNLYITRAEFWPESDEHPISVEEWRRFVDRDADLKWNPENGPHFADLTIAGQLSWLNWNRGCIDSKWPSQGTFAKMLEVAKKLKAKIQGEEGQPYKSLADWQAAFAPQPAPATSKPFATVVERFRPVMQKAGFVEIKEMLWSRPHPILPIENRFELLKQQSGKVLAATWGFWFAFAPTVGNRGFHWGSHKRRHFDFAVNHGFPAPNRLADLRFVITQQDAKAKGRTALAALSEALIEAEALYASVHKIKDLLSLLQEEKRTFGEHRSRWHDESWAFVLLALGKSKEGMRKLNYLRKLDGQPLFSEDRVVPHIERILKTFERKFKRSASKKSK